MQLRVNPGEVRQNFGPEEEEQEGDNWFNRFFKMSYFQESTADMDVKRIAE